VTHVIGLRDSRAVHSLTGDAREPAAIVRGEVGFGDSVGNSVDAVIHRVVE
jgi:hypothetical protein